MPYPRSDPFLPDRASGVRESLGDAVISAAITGTIASVVSGAILSTGACVEGKGPLQPVNATSHWLHGPAAGRRRTVDVTHTGVGYATHHASAVFWALPFEFWARRSRLEGAELLGAASVVAAAAAVLDYGILPRKLAPGWEHALSRSGVAAGFVGLGLGLAVGAAFTRACRQKRLRPPSRRRPY